MARKLYRSFRPWAFVLAVDTLFAARALANSRCEADLARVENAFCIDEGHLDGSKELAYSWQTNDATFDLVTKVCLSGGGEIGQRLDTIFALDRSSSVWSFDAGRRKLNIDDIGMVRYQIETLRREAEEAPHLAARVGLMLFSTDNHCREYTSGSLDIGSEFPCVFVPAGLTSDKAHVDKLLALLAAADGQFSDGGKAASSDLTIVAEALAKDLFGLKTAAQAGLVLLTDGRSYLGSADSDPYALYRSEAYRHGQERARGAFANTALAQYRLVFGLAELTTLAFDRLAIDSYATMCALATANAKDCQAPVDRQDPKTWPANKVDVKAFAKTIVAATGGGEVVTIGTREALVAAIDKLRVQDHNANPFEAVSLEVAGFGRFAGVVSGTQLRFANLPTAQSLDVQLVLQSGRGEKKVPAKIQTVRQDEGDSEIQDREMFCRASTALGRAQLQGGAASCGLVGAEAAASGGASSPALWLLLLPLVFLVLPRRLLPRGGAALLLGAGLGFVATPKAHADSAQKGVSALQFRPVVDGVAHVEKAATLAPGQLNAGLFVDYANDAVELASAKKKRTSSVVDDLWVLHAGFAVGLVDGIAALAHLPYVQSGYVERNMDENQVLGGSLGQTGDGTLAVKAKLLERSAWALAVMPFVTIPTGRSQKLIGDGQSNYGLMGLLSGTAGRWSWAYNGGYLQRDAARELRDDRAETVTVRGQLLNFVGAEYALTQTASIGAHLQAKSSAGESLQLGAASPAEWSALAKLRPVGAFEFSAGAGTGLGMGVGAPDYRLWLGLSWLPRPAAPLVRAAAAPSTRPAAAPRR